MEPEYILESDSGERLKYIVHQRNGSKVYSSKVENS